MWYLPQSSNPNKHELMPSNYPWQVSHSYIDGFIEISEVDFNNLISNTDISLYNNEVQRLKNLERQTSQREFGIELVPSLIDKMGERNLTLIQRGTSVNITAIASDNASVKLLIETGALSTARSICGMLKMKYASHADIYDYVISSITDFLTTKGYD
jgi:hypothetical protein